MTDNRQLRRWAVFNLVGVAGFLLQLGVLVILKRGLSLNYLAATALAVEIAVLHNFLWHEHVTWVDVIAPAPHGKLRRLLHFHLCNGLVSIGGNVLLTWLLVESLHWPYLLANAVAVVVCSILNFLLADLLVFRKGIHQGCHTQ